MLNGMMNLLDKIQKVILNFYNTRVMQKLKTQNRWERKGSHR